MKSDKSLKLDKKDIKILKVLAINARAPISEISKKAQINRDSVVYRLKKMQATGLISMFHTLLDASKIGFGFRAYINISLKEFEQDRIQSFVNFIKSHPFIVYGAKVSGRFNYMIMLYSRDIIHFDEILKDILEKFHHIIKDYETINMLDEFKYDIMTGLLEEYQKEKEPKES